MGSTTRRAPARTCVACRTERPKRDLVRIVRTPDGALVLDPSGKLAGRGAYLCAADACRDVALKRHALERALKAPLPTALLQQLAGAAAMIAEGGTSGS
ncbi:MAG: RNase P modulator RnpM [Candidatus Limnocylindrales bacterium]